MTEAKFTPDSLMRHLMAQRTPAERLRMSSRMFATAKTLALAGIASLNGATEIAEQRRQVFLRFYGNEFTGPQRHVIVTAIMDFHKSP